MQRELGDQEARRENIQQVLDKSLYLSKWQKEMIDFILCLRKKRSMSLLIVFSLVLTIVAFFFQKIKRNSFFFYHITHYKIPWNENKAFPFLIYPPLHSEWCKIKIQKTQKKKSCCSLACKTVVSQHGWQLSWTVFPLCSLTYWRSRVFWQNFLLHGHNTYCILCRKAQARLTLEQTMPSTLFPSTQQAQLNHRMSPGMVSVEMLLCSVSQQLPERCDDCHGLFSITLKKIAWAKIEGTNIP